jgi:translation initiation factor IF-2
MTKTQKTKTNFRPPVVAVLGHVDHGKTTLLDAIRKSNVAAGEHGGITQAIGAYQVKVGDRFITFIDTPGHEAFAKMRSRGASAADIAILVVAADDSVKPQTVESIAQIRGAGIPMIVAVNKIDMPGANVEKVRQDLARHEVQVEGFGGDVPIAQVSAKQAKGIDDLLSTILLLWDTKGVADDPQAAMESVVIETRVDKGRGMIATLLVGHGTLTPGSTLFEGTKALGRVRAMFDEYDKTVTAAPPGKPVVVLGFTTLPSVGARITGTQAAPEAQKAEAPKEEGAMPSFLDPIDMAAVKTLNLIVKADTAGSLEAITSKLTTGVRLVATGIGDVSDADVLRAKSSGAIIIGFGVKTPASVAKLATAEKVIWRTYTLIYELLDELEDVLSGMETVFVQERELGVGTIVAEFPFDRDRVAGTKVTSGRLAKGDTVKIMRKDAEIGRARIKSMRRGPEETTKTEAGGECGILLDKQIDFMLQDVIIAFTTG